MGSDIHSTEQKIMKQLGIESWRNLSKDKFMTFVSDLPKVDKEVALEIVAQFPNFKDLVLSSLDHAKETIDHGREINWKSQKKFHKALKEYRQILSKELDRENLTSEERFEVLKLLREAIEMESAKDSEDKKFQVVISGMVLAFGATAIAAAVAALGGKSHISGELDSSD